MANELCLTISKKPLYNKSKRNANTLVRALSVLDNLQIFKGSLNDLADKIENGYVIIPALLEKKVVNGNGIYTRSMANFKSIEVLAIDIDNSDHFIDPITKEQIKIDYYIGDTKHISIEDAKAVLNELGLNYSMIYTTLSHSQKQHKFRVVFTLNKPIYDVKEAKQIYLNLGYTLEKLGLEVDGRALEPSRLFFPGKVLELKTNSYLDILKLKEYKKTNKKVKKDKNINKIIESDTISITRQSDIKPLKDINTFSMDSIINHINDKIKYPLEIDYNNRYILLNTMIDLNELLNTEEYKKFQCVLPEHLDSDGSAYVYKSEDNITVYHCFGCGNRLNPVQFIKYYFDLDEATLFKLLEQNTLLKIGSIYQKTVQDISFKTIMYMSDKNGLQNDSEIVFKYLSRRNLIPLLESMYILGSLNATKMPLIEREDSFMGASFFMANSSLQEYYNRKYKSRLTENNIRNKVNALANLGLIEKIALKDVRKDIKDNCIAYLKKMGLYKYPNFYLIKPLTIDILKKAENIIVLEKNSCAKARNQGKKQTTIIQGENANNIFIQNNKEIDIISEPLYKQLIIAIDNLEREYFTLDDILKEVDKKRKYKKAYKLKQIEIYLSKLLLDKKINRVKGSKANKTKYSIQSDKITQYTFVYILNK